MALKVPNYDQATYPPQSALDTADIGAIVAGIGRAGVLTGCAVTQRGAGANMSVDIAAGVVMLSGVAASVTAANVAVTAADATNPRIDLVVSSSAGALSVIAGTAAASPEAPETFDPATQILLAAVYVPANATTVATAQIIDKRVVLGVAAALAVVSFTNASNYVLASATLTDVDATNVAITFTAPPSGKVILVASYYGNSSTDIVSFAWREATTTVSTIEKAQESNMTVRQQMRWYVTGIAAGSHTYKLAWKTATGANATIKNEPIILEVWAA